MDELGKDFFPKECWGCYDNCFKCTRKINSASVSTIRQLAATRKLKLQAIARMQRDVEKIDNQIYTMLSR